MATTEHKFNAGDKVYEVYEDNVAEKSAPPEWVRRVDLDPLTIEYVLIEEEGVIQYVLDEGDWDIDPGSCRAEEDLFLIRSEAVAECKRRNAEAAGGE